MPLIPPIGFSYGDYEPAKKLISVDVNNEPNTIQPTESILEKIAKQRGKQLKLGYTPKHDSEYNCLGQLIQAGYALLAESLITRLTLIPQNWDSVLWEKYCIKPKEERLILAAAFIVAEIERNNFVKQQK